MREQDNTGKNPTSRQRSVALVLLCLLGACLNPRPEELPSSNLDPESPATDRLAPPSANAELAPEPTSAPADADDLSDEPALQAPEPPALAAPPGDAGAPAGTELDAGIGEGPLPGDAG